MSCTMHPTHSNLVTIGNFIKTEVAFKHHAESSPVRACLTGSSRSNYYEEKEKEKENSNVFS